MEYSFHHEDDSRVPNRHARRLAGEAGRRDGVRQGEGVACADDRRARCDAPGAPSWSATKREAFRQIERLHGLALTVVAASELAFRKAFKARFGLTPTAYRRNAASGTSSSRSPSSASHAI